MENEAKKSLLLTEKENLKKKGNMTRVVAVVMILILILSYYMNLYVIPVSIVCIVVAFGVFFAVGLPTQLKLRKVNKELRTIIAE